jgi:hypothetical protein
MACLVSFIALFQGNLDEDMFEKFAEVVYRAV